MTSNDINPGKLLVLSGAYWETCTLHAGVKLDLFTRIGDAALSAHEAAGAIKGHPRATDLLLNALTAMGLLKKKEGRYRNTPLTRSVLCKDRPGYVGFMIMHHHHLVESWSRLDEAVLSGQPVRGRISQESEERRESFLMGMFNLAMAMAPKLVPTLDLSGRKRLLDLGGGPGTWAIHFCRHNPELDAVVFDLPTTRPFAEKTIARFDMAHRISFNGGNFNQDPVNGTFDAAWLSHILHGDPPEACRAIIAKTAAVLAPGGVMMIHDFILDDTRDGPLFPALFSMNMLLGTRGGRSYTETEIREMMADAGITDIRRTPYKGPTESGILVGVKP